MEDALDRYNRDFEPWTLDDYRGVTEYEPLPLLTYMYPGRYIVADPRLSYPRQLVVDQPAVQITGGRRQGAAVYVVENNTVVPYYLSDGTAPPPVRTPAPNGPVRPTPKPATTKAGSANR